MLARAVRPSAYVMLVAAGLACASTSLAQNTGAMPMHRRQAGLLVADLSQDRLALLRDMNNDGDAEDAGEETTFVDATNAAGIPAPSGAVFAIYQAIDGTVYYGEQDGRKVYAAKDLNLDGDANDAGELRVFFDETNAQFITMATPLGLTGDGTYLYISSAGTSISPQEGIYRVRDTDADGNANGAGEAVVFADMQVILGNNTSNMFDICYIPAQNALFVADTGPTPDVIYRVKDADNSGSIDVTEIGAFYAGATFGGPMGFMQTCVTDFTSIYSHERTASINPQRVCRLTDLNSSNSIDDSGEVSVVWSETNLPAGVPMATSQGIAVGYRQIAIVSNGTASGVSANVVILATDTDNDGKYITAGETVAFARNAGFPASARQVSFYAWPCPADFNMSGGITVQDIFDFLNAWFAGNSRADFNGGGVEVQDIFDFLNAWFAGGC